MIRSEYPEGSNPDPAAEPNLRRDLERALDMWRLDFSSLDDCELQRIVDYQRVSLATKGHAKCPIPGFVRRERVYNDRFQKCWRWIASTAIYKGGITSDPKSFVHKIDHQEYTRKHQALRSLATWRARRWASELAPGMRTLP